MIKSDKILYVFVIFLLLYANYRQYQSVKSLCITVWEQSEGKTMHGQCVDKWYTPDESMRIAKAGRGAVIESGAARDADLMSADDVANVMPRRR